MNKTVKERIYLLRLEIKDLNSMINTVDGELVKTIIKEREAELAQLESLLNQ